MQDEERQDDGMVEVEEETSVVLVDVEIELVELIDTVFPSIQAPKQLHGASLPVELEVTRDGKPEELMEGTDVVTESEVRLESNECVLEYEADRRLADPDDSLDSSDVLERSEVLAVSDGVAVERVDAGFEASCGVAVAESVVRSWTEEAGGLWRTVSVA